MAPAATATSTSLTYCIWSNPKWVSRTEGPKDGGRGKLCIAVVKSEN